MEKKTFFTGDFLFSSYKKAITAELLTRVLQRVLQSIESRGAHGVFKWSLVSPIHLAEVLLYKTVELTLFACVVYELSSDRPILTPKHDSHTTTVASVYCQQKVD